MEKLSEQIRLLNHEESLLLRADKLPQKLQIETGMYLLCEDGNYTAFDYKDRQAWQETFGELQNAPEGWCKSFTTPLGAIDWLLSLV